MKAALLSWSVVAVVLATWIFSGGIATAQQIDAGTDCWITEPGTQISLPLLPAGFFGSKSGTPSDPIPAGTVVAMTGNPLPEAVVTGPCECPPGVVVTKTWDVHGNPVDPDSRHAVSETVDVQDIDTCVRRITAADVGSIGVPDTIDTEIIALSLVSIAPLVVTYGPEPPSFWDVFVTETGTQALGSMTFTRTGTSPMGTALGSMTNDSLPVQFQISFVDLSAQIPPQQMGPSTLDFINTDGEFTINPTNNIPTLSQWGLILLTLLMLTGGALVLARRRQA